MLELQPISFAEAAEFVHYHHRHNTAPVGHKFSIAVNNGEEVVGVAIVGRPIARHNDDGLTLEVLRVCVKDGCNNACSMLYGASWRAAKALGYRRLITYTLKTEPGTSLKAAGWRVVGETKEAPNGWNVPSRPRVLHAKYPTGQKTIWEMTTDM